MQERFDNNIYHAGFNAGVDALAGQVNLSNPELVMDVINEKNPYVKGTNEARTFERGFAEALNWPNKG